MSRAWEKAKAAGHWLGKVSAVIGAIAGAVGGGLIAAGVVAAATVEAGALAAGLTIGITALAGAAVGAAIGYVSGAINGGMLGGVYGAVTDEPKPQTIVVESPQHGRSRTYSHTSEVSTYPSGEMNMNVQGKPCCDNHFRKMAERSNAPAEYGR